jgi:hypothetical protein
MKQQFWGMMLSVFCTILFCSCATKRPPIDQISVGRSTVAFDAAKLGIPAGATVRIKIYNSNNFIQDTAKSIEQMLSEYGITVTQKGLPDYWLVLNGAFEHYTDSKEIMMFNRKVYDADIGKSTPVKFNIRTVNHFTLTSSEHVIVCHNKEYLPRIFYKDAVFSDAGMFCVITLYRTKDLNMLTSLQRENTQVAKKITLPEVFYGDFVKGASKFAVEKVVRKQ